MTRRLKSPPALFDYFHERVLDAHGAQSTVLSDDTLLYLSRLLTERARTDADQQPETTLAELHGRAAGERPSEQVAAYRELGDRALYRLGCFQESLQHRAVSPRYYSDMGAAAYWRVQTVMRTFFSNAFGPVFEELALGFDGCVALLERVRAEHSENEAESVMRLYQQWLATGSNDAARRLRAHGVVLVPSDVNA